MFIQNKYSKYYYNIINRAKSRDLDLDIYTEKHHIIPKSFFKEYTAGGWLEGNPNLKDNLVKLTAREHFICHLLLVRMTEGQAKIKMTHAAWRMCLKDSTGVNKRDYKISSRIYESLRVKRSEFLKAEAGPNHYNRGRKTGRTKEDFTLEWKENISKSKKGITVGEKNPMFGKTHSEETRAKLSATRKTRSGTPGWNIRPPCSDEKANKIKLANMGKRWVHNKATKERKYIDPLLVADYVNTGWELGLGPKF